VPHSATRRRFPSPTSGLPPARFPLLLAPDVPPLLTNHLQDEALTSRPFPRTPNLALRCARQSMRLSQAQFAEAIRAAGDAMGARNRCAKRLVQKWEGGEHGACRPDYLRVLQAVTGLSARELGFQVLPDASGVSIAWSGDGVPGAVDGSAVGTAVAAPALSGTMQYSPDGTAEDAMERLRYALAHPSTVDSRTADFVETATAGLFDLEHHSPARLLAPTVDRHLTTVTSLLTAARHEAVRSKLMISAGRTAMLAGWLAFDRGDTPSAQRFWDTSVSAAEGTADATVLAGSLVYLSYAAARRGDRATAWQLAHNAVAHTPADDLRAKSWATARIALYAARLGEHEAAQAALKQSLELGESLPSPRPGDGTTPWMRCFDHASLLASTAHTAAVLGEPNAADYAIKAVDALSPAKVKARAVVLAECALVAAVVSKFELCLDWGSAASTLAREMDVSVAADVLYEVVLVVRPYSDTRAVRELVSQIARVRRTGEAKGEAWP
jgi:hypothetical protein